MNQSTKEITERRIESLNLHHSDTQDKLVYYLLAITAGCIAFSVNLTKNYKLTINETPLGIAIVLWGLSFYSGIVQIQNKEVALQLNLRLLKLALTNSQIPDWVNNDIEAASIKGKKYRKLQNSLLLFGGICFLIWHVIRMYQYVPYIKN